MFAGQNGGPYSGSVTNPMMNPMMNNYSQNISAWMAPKQYGILATGVGSARDNILPGNVMKINRGKIFVGLVQVWSVDLCQEAKIVFRRTQTVIEGETICDGSQFEICHEKTSRKETKNARDGWLVNPEMDMLGFGERVERDLPRLKNVKNFSFFNLDCRFLGKITKMRTGVNSRTFTNSLYT